MKTITVDRQRFGIKTDPRTGTPCVSSIHPYDETEYHWALKSPAGMWKVYRRGKLVTIFGKSLNLEHLVSRPPPHRRFRLRAFESGAFTRSHRLLNQQAHSAKEGTP